MQSFYLFIYLLINEFIHEVPISIRLNSLFFYMLFSLVFHNCFVLIPLIFLSDIFHRFFNVVFFFGKRGVGGGGENAFTVCVLYIFYMQDDAKQILGQLGAWAGANVSEFQITSKYDETLKILFLK